VPSLAIGQVCLLPRKDAMDTDVEQNTMPGANLAPLQHKSSLAPEDHGNNLKPAHKYHVETPHFFVDLQEAIQNLQKQCNTAITNPNPLEVPLLLSDQSLDMDNMNSCLPSASNSEIQVVSHAFTQASCEDNQGTAEMKVASCFQYINSKS